ncbi:hypothetical protein BK703_16540 [Bacillus thuringiensis serovar silo]|uniref:hypothetical protein n=1 Tax=Bacillus thuringiensis TaxID=1428 RepID=UPI000A375B0F|nr:hypothetical protein [Bacillus thuringiensis]MED3275377.1 hypothetical protein [Bacillus thuringiensis]OTW55248.1 hypothetical protein BK703_16540 [Bacillus thuringiensis serovar silo]OTW74320.1 hypothetical protein BK700_01505 [Bacillus thuringiensis serovar toguchini]
MNATVEGLAKPTKLKVGDCVAILWTGRKAHEMYLVQEGNERVLNHGNAVHLACLNGENYAFMTKGQTCFGLLRRLSEHTTVEDFQVLPKEEWEMVIKRKVALK